MHEQARLLCVGHRFDRWQGMIAPYRYSEAFEDYFAATHRVAVLDASPIPSWALSGAGAGLVLDRLTMAAVAGLSAGTQVSSAMLRPDGTLVARVWVRREGDGGWLVSADADVGALLEQAVDGNVRLEHRARCALVLVGPHADDLADALSQWQAVEPWGPPIPHRGLAVSALEGPALWASVFQQGEQWGIAPMGTECLEALCIEAGAVLWPKHIDLEPTRDPAARTPSALGLEPHLLEVGDRDFVGAESARTRLDDPDALVSCRLQVSAEMVEALYREEGRPPPHRPSPTRLSRALFSADGTDTVGRVLAQVWSPRLKRFCLMAQVQRRHLQMPLRVEHRVGSSRRHLPATVAHEGGL